MRTEPLVPGAHVVGPVALRTVTLERACESRVRHTHDGYDHTTIVIRGRVEVRHDGNVTGHFGVGEAFVTLAGVDHEVKAIEGPAVFLCVFSHRDLHGVVVQRYDAATCLPLEQACL